MSLTNTKDTFQGITVSRATLDDSKDIWQWRNDEQTKLMSITTDDVSWETHSTWYERSLVNPNRYLYVGYVNNNEKVGMCRFDIDTEKGVAEVSINLNPLYRSKKLSSQLLSTAMKNFCGEKKMDLVATIKRANIGSMKCFTKIGFTFDRDDNGYDYYRYSST